MNESTSIKNIHVYNKGTESIQRGTTVNKTKLETLLNITCSNWPIKRIFSLVNQTNVIIFLYCNISCTYTKLTLVICIPLLVSFVFKIKFSHFLKDNEMWGRGGGVFKEIKICMEYNNIVKCPNDPFSLTSYLLTYFTLFEMSLTYYM